MLYATAAGTARLNVYAPAAKYYKQPADLPYCNAGKKVPGQIENQGHAQQKCQYHDEDFVVYPQVENNAIFLTTRVKAWNETLPPGCNAQTRNEP